MRQKIWAKELVILSRLQEWGIARPSTCTSIYFDGKTKDFLSPKDWNLLF